MILTSVFTLKEHPKNYGPSAIIYWLKEETSLSLMRLPINLNKSTYPVVRMVKEYLDSLKCIYQKSNIQKEPNLT